MKFGLRSAITGLLLTGVLSLNTAQADIITGTVWNDINADILMGDSTNNTLGTNILTQSDTSQVGDLGSNTYGDPIAPGSGVETGYENVSLCVTSTTTCTTTAADGSYSLDVPVGESITVTAPLGFKFSSDDPAGDNDADQQAIAPTPPDPWTAEISAASIAADNTDVGLRPLPEIQISYLDLNGVSTDGVQGIETGTPVYNVFGNCNGGAAYDDEDPTALPLAGTTDPGDDCHKYDDLVRTNDIVTITPAITLDNAPAGGIDNVIIEMQFSPVGGADIRIESGSISGIPTSCGTGSGFSPESSVTNNPDGSIVLICNMGNIENGQLFAPISIKPTGNSPNGSNFITEIRTYAAANDALPSPELPVPEIDISAVPRFDLTKNIGSATSPPNRVAQDAGLATRTNPVTGISEPGYVFWYDMSIVVEGDGKGVAALANEFTFEEIIDPTYEALGAHIFNCNPYFYTATPSSLPENGNGGAYRPDATINSGSGHVLLMVLPMPLRLRERILLVHIIRLKDKMVMQPLHGSMPLPDQCVSGIRFLPFILLVARMIQQLQVVMLEYGMAQQ
jgi:hypothetical protein